ncbi:MAG: RNA polymerase sigma-70 factor [Mediterranea sp.]|nr:RNA polymerase sigma-70 factor [Mediterranea sp.]
MFTIHETTTNDNSYPYNESEALRLVALGDADAFRSLYLYYYDRLFRFAMGFLRSEAASEDVVSDVFFNLWQDRLRLSSIPRFRPYIYTSVRNACLNVLKSHQVSRRDDLRPDEVEPQVEIPANTPFDYLSYKELADAVLRAVDALPERCRMVFKLRQEDELSHQEIARVMGITVRTVERQIMLAKEKIRQALRGYKET